MRARGRRWLKRAGYGLLALAVLLTAAYWWLLVESHRADPDRFPIDLAAIRRLADAPGEKPQQIRVETVAHLAAPETFLIAGTGWRTIDMPVAAYELVYPDGVAVLDTAFDPGIARAMTATRFDGGAYARIGRALGRARWIVVTHEHPDHVGGLLAQPDVRQRLATARLTRGQIAEIAAHPDAFAPVRVPPDLFAGYRPLAYDRYRALSPGVVLIKAPGHTPGSQMVYVRRADGVEYLFLGDVAWWGRNVEGPREKARLVAWLSDEDRGRVRDELAALHRLQAAAPGLHMVPGHDPAALDALVRTGLLTPGF